MQERQVRSLGQEDPPEKKMATHSSIPAWEIPWTEAPSRLQSTGSQRFEYDLATKKKKQMFPPTQSYGQPSRVFQKLLLIKILLSKARTKRVPRDKDEPHLLPLHPCPPHVNFNYPKQELRPLLYFYTDCKMSGSKIMGLYLMYIHLGVCTSWWL